MARYNELCDGVTNLTSKAFTPMHVREDPKVYTGCVIMDGRTIPKILFRSTR